MKRFPNHRPARLAGIEDCLTVAHRDHGPRWSLFWRTLAMGFVAFSVGLLIAAAAWHA